MKKTILIIGSKGKMGSLLISKIPPSFNAIGIDIGDTFPKLADLAIDFSTGSNSAQSAIFCKNHKIFPISLQNYISELSYTL